MARTNARNLKTVGLTAAIALLAACQGSSSSSGTAKMSVHLVDGPSGAYSQVNVHVVRVEIAKSGEGWLKLGEPDVTVDLLQLTGGVAETLVDGASVPAGTYGQMRLVLGAGNTVCVEPVTEAGECPAGALHDLKVPSGMQSGVKLNAHFVVEPDTTKDVFIDFDAFRSVFVHRAGNSMQYILRPVVRAFDRVVSGAVKGVVTDAATKAPLAGVEVMAETLDAGGHPTVANHATTGADGSYVLRLLPMGSYWIVGQPRTDTAAYEANAAGPIAVTETAPVATADVAFAQAASVGGLDGTVAPVAAEGQLDEVTLLGDVTVASVAHTFVLRRTSAVAADPETWAIDLLPAATYSLFVTRATPAGETYTYADGPALSATVTAGTTTHVATPLAAP